MARLSSIFVIGLMAFNQNVFAEPMKEKLNFPQGTSALSDNPYRPANYFGHIRIEGMQYFTPVAENPDLTYSQLLSARLSILKEANWIDSALDISGGTFFSMPHSHYVVHEAYLASPQRYNTVAFVGRKKMSWSDLDQRWQLGQWQPKFAIDTLRPEEQGLAGFFLDYKRPSFEFLFFATPIFIPNMGPDIREESGSLVSDSRWYRAPSKNFEFGNNINTISYSLDIPEYERLVLNGGGAIMVQVGNTRSGPWARTSYGYMPVNDLILGRKNFKNVEGDTVDVTVSPDITYHTIASADMGYNFTENTRLVLSYLQDNPVEKRPEEDWIIQRLEPLQAYSVAFDFSLADRLPIPVSIGIEYFRVSGGKIKDILQDGSSDDFTMFENRLNYTNALSIKAEGELARLWGRPFVARLRYLYEYDQLGSLLQTEFLYYPQQQWAVVIGGDILGVQDENSESATFLNQYRANDRVYGGMTYVF